MRLNEVPGRVVALKVPTQEIGVKMKTSQDVEIEMFKAELDSLNLRIKFLENNWLLWTKQTTEIGRQVVAALQEKTEGKDKC